MLFIQWTMMKALHDTVYHWLLEEINSDHEGNNKKKSIDIANLSLYISAGEESRNEECGEPIKKDNQKLQSHYS